MVPAASVVAVAAFEAIPGAQAGCNCVKEGKNMEFENLMHDHEFCEKLENAENDDVIIQLLAEKGIDVTKEQLAEAREMISRGDELDEEMLDKVSSGFGAVMVSLLIISLYLVFKASLARDQAKRGRKK